MALGTQYEMLRKVPGFLNIGYSTGLGKHRLIVLSTQNSLFLYSYFLYYFPYKKLEAYFCLNLYLLFPMKTKSC